MTLLLAEGHAVGALILGGIALVGAHQNALQSAVVAGVGMVGALMDSALDALVGIGHDHSPPFSWVRKLVWTDFRRLCKLEFFALLRGYLGPLPEGSEANPITIAKQLTKNDVS